MSIIPRKYYLDSLFDNFFTDGAGDVMKCDIYEKDGKYHVEADIPGFKKDEIQVSCKDNYLTITASKEDSNEESDKSYIKKERTYSKLERQFYVGDMDEEHVKAEFKDGVLTICVPKVEKQENKKLIQID